MVFDDYLCEKCDKKYTDMESKWCQSCQINNLKTNLINWTNGDEEIDGFIQEMQLKIKNSTDIIFEWIPYNQFSFIKIFDNDESTIYKATWKDGLLKYNSNKKKYERIPIQDVFLKFFNKV